jgi:hypothetical protein
MSIRRAGEVSIALAYLMVAGMFYFIAAIPSLIVMVFWAVIILIGLLFFLILLL